MLICTYHDQTDDNRMILLCVFILMSTIINRTHQSHCIPRRCVCHTIHVSYALSSSIYVLILRPRDALWSACWSAFDALTANSSMSSYDRPCDPRPSSIRPAIVHSAAQHTSYIDRLYIAHRRSYTTAVMTPYRATTMVALLVVVVVAMMMATNVEARAGKAKREKLKNEINAFHKTGRCWLLSVYDHDAASFMLIRLR